VPAFDGGAEVHGRDGDFIRPGEIDDRQAGRCREFERGLGKAFFLVRSAQVPVLRALHKLHSGTGRYWDMVRHR
jgi:hypothetical protein